MSSFREKGGSESGAESQGVGSRESVGRRDIEQREGRADEDEAISRHAKLARSAGVAC